MSKNEEVKIGYYENGTKKYEEHYKDGILNGLFTLWYDNGNKSCEVYYKDGLEDGVSTWWHEDGTKKSVKHYKDDYWNGLWVEYRPDGSKFFEKFSWYEDGTWQENFKLYKDGEVIEVA